MRRCQLHACMQAWHVGVGLSSATQWSRAVVLVMGFVIGSGARMLFVSSLLGARHCSPACPCLACQHDKHCFEQSTHLPSCAVLAPCCSPRGCQGRPASSHAADAPRTTTCRSQAARLDTPAAAAAARPPWISRGQPLAAAAAAGTVPAAVATAAAASAAQGHQRRAAEAC